MYIEPELGKYYTLDKCDEEIGILKEISEDEYSVIVKSSNEVHRFLYFNRRFTQIIQNIDDYISKYHTYINQEFVDNYEEVEITFSDVNRIFENIIASFKIFVEHAENRFKKKYGEGSTEFHKWKKYTSDKYDGHFEYRFLIRLRDYSQHHDFPISNFSTDTESKGVIKIKFIKEKLLLDDIIRSKLSPDLQRYGDTFEVTPIVLEFRKVIADFMRIIAEIEINDLKNHINNILRIYNKFKNIEGTLSIGKFEEIKNYGSSQHGMFNTIQLPVKASILFYDLIKDSKL